MDPPYPHFSIQAKKEIEKQPIEEEPAQNTSEEGIEIEKPPIEQAPSQDILEKALEPEITYLPPSLENAVHQEYRQHQLVTQLESQLPLKRPTLPIENQPPVKKIKTEEKAIVIDATNAKKRGIPMTTDNRPIKKSKEGLFEDWKENLKNIKNNKEAEDFHEKLCNFTASELKRPVPLSLRELKALDELFFSNQLAKLSEQALDISSYPSTLIHDLCQCISYLEPHASIDEILRNCKQIEVPSLIASGHNNKVMFLKNAQGINRWVFKPMTKKVGATKIPCLAQTKRELVAHLVNFHGLFPIPFTLLLSFKNTVVSIHDYINGKQGTMEMELQSISSNSPDDSTESSSLQESKYLPMNSASLHQLLLFDLLFSNGDRNDDNIIFYKDEQDTEYFAMGIDHGDCMIYGFQDTIKIDYLSLGEFLSPLKKEAISDLVTEVNEKKYKEIMATHAIQDVPIEWMSVVCQCVRSLLLGKEYESFAGEEIANILLFLHKNRNSCEFKDMPALFKNVITWLMDFKYAIKKEIVPIETVIEYELEKIDKSTQGKINLSLLKPVFIFVVTKSITYEKVVKLNNFKASDED